MNYVIKNKRNYEVSIGTRTQGLVEGTHIELSNFNCILSLGENSKIKIFQLLIKKKK